MHEGKEAIMAGRIHLDQLSTAIAEAVKSAHQKLPHEELIMGFIAPEALAEAQAESIAKQITQRVAPGAQPFVGTVGAAGPAAATASFRPGRLLGFRPSPDFLKQ
jgi:hypothetical protein